MTTSIMEESNAALRRAVQQRLDNTHREEPDVLRGLRIADGPACQHPPGCGVREHRAVAGLHGADCRQDSATADVLPDGSACT